MKVEIKTPVGELDEFKTETFNVTDVDITPETAEDVVMEIFKDYLDKAAEEAYKTLKNEEIDYQEYRDAFDNKTEITITIEE